MITETQMKFEKLILEGQKIIKQLGNRLCLDNGAEIFLTSDNKVVLSDGLKLNTSGCLYPTELFNGNKKEYLHSRDYVKDTYLGSIVYITEVDAEYYVKYFHHMFEPLFINGEHVDVNAELRLPRKARSYRRK